MLFNQYYLGCLAQASYLIGDEETGAAVIVDPRRDVDEYLADAATHGLRIEYVFLTHFHADFVAGHLELRERTGATICLGANATAEYAFRPLHDGETLDVGRVRLRVLETPGHTPEGISLLVYDLDRTPSARTPSSPATRSSSATWAARTWPWPRTSRRRAWPATSTAPSTRSFCPSREETLVYPGHGAGSLCGRALSDANVSTMGEQRRDNYALQPMAEDEFVAVVTAEQPESPEYFGFDAALNRAEHPVLDRTLDQGVKQLSLDDVLRLQGEGASIVDVRESAEFAGAHLKGSLNIGLNGRYASWAGTVISPGASVVIVAEPGQEREAALRLAYRLRQPRRLPGRRHAGALGPGPISSRRRPESPPACSASVSMPRRTGAGVRRHGRGVQGGAHLAQREHPPGRARGPYRRAPARPRRRRPVRLGVSLVASGKPASGAWPRQRLRPGGRAGGVDRVRLPDERVAV